MGDKVSSSELTTESVQLSDGMLGIIGAYGMRSAFEVRDLYPKAESPSEGSIPSVAADTSRGLRPKVNALG